MLIDRPAVIILAQRIDHTLLGLANQVTKLVTVVINIQMKIYWLYYDKICARIG